MVRMHDYERRSCSLSIDVHFPKLEVAGSIPVSRFSFQRFTCQPFRQFSLVSNKEKYRPSRGDGELLSPGVKELETEL
jgi:hypothetical protein